MPQNLVLTLVIAAAGLAAAAVAGYYVIRYMRGSIKLALQRVTFNPGDTIAGSFALLVKKPIQGNKLTVSLIGTEVTKTYEDGKSRTRSREVYRDEKVIEEARSYQPGHNASHEFAIPVPNSTEPSFAGSPVVQAIGTAVQFLSNRQCYLKWRVEARLDAKGIDLAASKQVTVNLPGRL